MSLILVAKRTLSHVMVPIVSRVALAISDKVRSIFVGVSSDVLIMSMKLRSAWSRYVAQLAEVSVTSSSRYGRSAATNQHNLPTRMAAEWFAGRGGLAITVFLQ